MKPRHLVEDLEKLPQNAAGTDDSMDVPVEEFSMVFLERKGWKEGMGTECNAKAEVEIDEPMRKNKRWGIGYEDVVIGNNIGKGVVGFTSHPFESIGDQGAGNFGNEVGKKKRFDNGEW